MASLECSAQRAPIFDDYLGTVAADEAEAVCMNQASMSLQILIETASPSLAVDPRVEETHHGDGLRYRPSRASSRTTQRDRGTGPKSRQNSGCAVRPPGSER